MVFDGKPSIGVRLCEKMHYQKMLSATLTRHQCPIDPVMSFIKIRPCISEIVETCLPKCIFDRIVVLL